MDPYQTVRRGGLRNAHEIRDAVDRGCRVFWKTLRYPVHRDGSGQYFIGEGPGMIALTWSDGVTLNGKPEDFFVLSEAEYLETHPGTLQ